MSLTKRTWTTPLLGSHTLTFTGSVTGASTKLTIVFQASGAIYGMTASINVYVNGTRQSCTWTTNKTETMLSTTYKTKMTSSQMTISKPFFTLKLTDSSDGSEIYQETFSFYEIEKTPTAATTSGASWTGAPSQRWSSPPPALTPHTAPHLRWGRTQAPPHQLPRPWNTPSRPAGATLCPTPRPERPTWSVRCYTAGRFILRSQRLYLSLYHHL